MVAWLWWACTGPQPVEQPLVEAEVRLGPMVSCDAPAGGSPYDTVRIETSTNSDPWIWGGGLLVADLEGDAGLEVWLTTQAGIRAWTVRAGSLVETAAPEGVDFGTGAVAADYDGDGDLDVFVSRWAGEPAERADGRDRLFRNDGDGQFVEVGEAMGLHGCEGPGACTRSVPASFGDIDHDGDLDLFVGSHGDMVGGIDATEQDDGDRSHLYLNQGDGTFVNASDTLPDRLHHGYTLGGGFVDLDGDGWLDLLAAHDLGRRLPNVVLWNERGTLQSGDPRGLDVAANSMGLAVGDLNADGRPDLLIPSWNDLVYLESLSEQDAWIEASATRGIDVGENRPVTWGGAFADLDNDGDLDLVVAAGWLHAFGTPDWRNPRWQADLVFRNDGTPMEPAFVPVASEWSLDDVAVHRAHAVADLDRNGFLDLLVHDLEGELKVHWARCTDAAWVRVVLEDPGWDNRFGVGSVVVVEAGDHVWRRTVRAGGTSMGVGLPPEVHVGLGDVDQIDRITVYWSGGARSEVVDVAPRREVRMRRPATTR